MKCPAVGPRRRCRSLSTPAAGRWRRMYGSGFQPDKGLDSENLLDPAIGALLKIEAAVDQEGKVVAVRCRASLDVGVEAVFEGVAPGYRLEKTASDVEDLLEEGVLWSAGIRRR
jgi:hypothetical protein